LCDATFCRSTVYLFKFCQLTRFTLRMLHNSLKFKIYIKRPPLEIRFSQKEGLFSTFLWILFAFHRWRGKDYILPLYGGYISVKKRLTSRIFFFFFKENIYKMND
jgi:uncharacterized membrane protein